MIFCIIQRKVAFYIDFTIERWYYNKKEIGGKFFMGIQTEANLEEIQETIASHASSFVPTSFRCQGHAENK